MVIFYKGTVAVCDKNTQDSNFLRLLSKISLHAKYPHEYLDLNILFYTVVNLFVVSI